MRTAVQRLVAAHVDLAKAELGDILDEIKGVAVLSGVAIGALILAGLLFGVGLFLFLAEWLFGSIGWGVLHGPLFLTGVAIAAVLAALGYGGGRIGLNFGLAVLVGVLVGVVLGADLTNRAWSALGDSIATNYSADVRPLVVAAATLALLGGLLGLIAGARGGGIGGAIAGLLVGAIVGALLGALGPRVGAAIGVTVALIAWPVFMGIGVARTGIDTDKLKDRFYPKATIDTTKETIEWVRKRTPLGPAS
jgi:MFS family permease